MSKIKNQMVQPESTSAGEGGVHRRRFVRGVGILVPAALTITSRSASAAGCLSASASASINLANSRPDRSSGSCANGKSPGYWQNAATTHNDTTARSRLFSDIFVGGFANKSMEDVINLTGNQDPQQFGGHLAAAWCNFFKGYVDASVISLLTLQAMWAGRNAGFNPIPGNTAVVWNQAQMVTYLKTTQF